MEARRRVLYDPYSESKPMPILAHTNEVVINVDLGKKLYPLLKQGMSIPIELRRELLKLFETTPI
jgi:hypothetical protein